MRHTNTSFFCIVPLPVLTAVCAWRTGLAPELTFNRVRGICHQVCGCSSQGEQLGCFNGVIHLTSMLEVKVTGTLAKLL